MSMSEAPVSPIEDLCNLLKECGVTPKIGLEAQGHIPKIEAMLAEGKAWSEIGKAIGWHGPTAHEWYDRYRWRKEIEERERERIIAMLTSPKTEGDLAVYGWTQAGPMGYAVADHVLRAFLTPKQ